MNGNRLIVHALIRVNNKYLVTKSSKNEDTFPEYWDIPGGLVEYGELPKNAVIRETKEEVNLNIVPVSIIHEDSNFDEEKDMIFIRLVYLSELDDSINNIKIDYNEHSEYRLINSIDELDNELISPFLDELMKKDLNPNL